MAIHDLITIKCYSCKKALKRKNTIAMCDGTVEIYYEPCDCQKPKEWGVEWDAVSLEKNNVRFAAQPEPPAERLTLGDCKWGDWVEVDLEKNGVSNVFLFCHTFGEEAILSDNKTIINWPKDTPCRLLSAAEIKEIKK